LINQILCHPKLHIAILGLSSPTYVENTPEKDANSIIFNEQRNIKPGKRSSAKEERGYLCNCP
jgi:hypothetical protein